MKTAKDFFRNQLGVPVLISNIIGIVIGLSFWLFDVSATVPIWLYIITICIAIIIVWILLLKICSSPEVSNSFVLSIVRFNLQSNKVICILNPCEHITIGTYVTFFHLSDGFESYLATGQVINIQNNSFIQVQIDEACDLEAYITSVRENSIIFINSLIVKPIITKTYIERMFGNE